jgi:hypothetical protein
MTFNFYRFAKDRPRFTDNLDVIKFLCKDLWTVLFKKQIDNLKTNHRVRRFNKCNCRPQDIIACFMVLVKLTRDKQGVYVLTDSAFRPFGRMSMAVRSEAISMAQAVSKHSQLPRILAD